MYLKIRWVGMELIRLARDSHRWRAVVNRVFNFRIP